MVKTVCIICSEEIKYPQEVVVDVCKECCL